MFRVVPDQLKISDGWVRCGHCADVFDATLHLETWVPPAPSPAAEVSRPPAPVATLPQVAASGARASPAGTDADRDLSAPSSIPRSDRFVRREQRIQVDVPPGVSRGVPSPLDGFSHRGPPSEPSLARSPAQGQRAEGLINPPADGSDKFDVTVPAPLESVSLKANERGRPSQVGGLSATTAVVPIRGGPTPAVVGPSDPSISTGAVLDHLDAGDGDFLSELQRFATKTSGDEPKPDNKPPEFRLKRSVVKAKAQEGPPGAPPAHALSPSPFTEQSEVAVPQKVAKDAMQLTQVGLDDDRKTGPNEQPAQAKKAAEVAEVLLPAEPEFIQQARRRAYWQSPAMRALLAGAVMVLAGLLTLQWAMFERNRLVAWKPGWQPTFQAMCGVLGCTLAPVQRIDAIVIDSTALVRRLGNFYSFDLVLKNTAPISVAVPALELSLTDSGDNVISRRVFLPKELPAVPELLPAGGSVSVSLRLSIAVGDSLPMAGYRALVFYP